MDHEIRNLEFQFKNLPKQFRQLRVDEYDETYFPKATKVRVYYNVSVDRPLWVLSPQFCHPDGAYELLRINSRDKDFRKIVNPIVNSNKFNIRIETVYEVVNRYLERQYELKKLQDRMINCREYVMYHTTVENNVHSICTDNFNWRLSGLSRGSKYGFGVSFTPYPDFAHQFCKAKKIKVMIVTKVLIGTTQIGTKDQVLPAHGFDTTGPSSNKVYVKFEDCEFLPQYVVYYKFV